MSKDHFVKKLRHMNSFLFVTVMAACGLSPYWEVISKHDTIPISHECRKQMSSGRATKPHLQLESADEVSLMSLVQSWWKWRGSKGEGHGLLVSSTPFLHSPLTSISTPPSLWSQGSSFRCLSPSCSIRHWNWMRSCSRQSIFSSDSWHVSLCYTSIYWCIGKIHSYYTNYSFPSL